jgi:hypothetical protein
LPVQESFREKRVEPTNSEIPPAYGVLVAESARYVSGIIVHVCELQSIGFKEENLEYDQTCGLLLRDTYRGVYEMKTRGGGWNETETFTATTIDSNLRLFSNAQNSNLRIEVSLVAALVVAVVAMFVILHRRAFLLRGC